MDTHDPHGHGSDETADENQVASDQPEAGQEAGEATDQDGAQEEALEAGSDAPADESGQDEGAAEADRDLVPIEGPVDGAAAASEAVSAEEETPEEDEASSDLNKPERIDVEEPEEASEDAEPEADDASDAEGNEDVQGEFEDADEAAGETDAEASGSEDGSDAADEAPASEGDQDKAAETDADEGAEAPQEAGDGEGAEDAEAAEDAAEASYEEGLPTQQEKKGWLARRREKRAAKAAEDEAVAHARHAQPEGEAAVAGGYAAGIFPEIPKKKSHKGLKVFGIVVGIIVLVLVAAYLVGLFLFSSRFLPNTILGEHDVSLRTNEDAVLLLQGDTENYAIEVTGDGFLYEASGDDLGVAIDAQQVVNDIHSVLPAWQWPYLIIQPEHDMTYLIDVTFKRGSAEKPLAKAIDKFNKTATPPQNATIGYDEKAKRFVVQPEKLGTQINPEYTVQAFAEAVTQLQPQLEITDRFLVQPTITSEDEKLIESAELATGMTSADLTLVMGGSEVRKITGADLSQFVIVDDKLDVTFDDKAMDAWCEAVAEEFNTVGTQRTYTRADGKVITVDGGVYGWEIDKEALKKALIESIKEGKKAQVEVPFVTEAAVYTAPGAPDWGNRYIDVDIAEQHVRFYDQNGKLFWETDCITGSPDGRHDTVTGVWKVNDKQSPSVLKGYENGKKIYETKVTFWMPFEGNSIGFHDATWQPGFGGTMYADGYGSHGCVNLSYAAAEELYGLIQEGDVVVVHY